jgi:hypothetical protein
MRPLAPAEADFGVVVTVTRRDLHWARGTCASVRYFMPDVPVWLLLDGPGSTADLERAYGVRVDRTEDVDHPGLQEVSFGSYLTKLSTLWLAPFETFLFLDADTVVWGDLREHADLERFDFVLDRPIGGSPHVDRWIMDVDAAARHFPQFDARGHVDDYVNNGAFFARRGALDLERYLDLARFSREHPGVFLTDLGIFNFMLFGGADEGTLRLSQRDLQVLVGFSSRHNLLRGARFEDLQRRFSLADGRPVVDSPVVLHWAGPVKPALNGGERDLVEPMSFFRRRFRIDRRGGGQPTSWDELQLWLEDLPQRLRPLPRRLRRVASRVRARLRPRL